MINFFLKIFIFLNIFQIDAFNYNSNKIIKYKKNKINSIVMNYNVCPDYLDKYTKFLNEDQSETVVKSITGFLTKVDGLGGYILHTNDILINCILNNNLLPIENKKSIILFLIQFSQEGDSMGSHILQLYHDIVNCLL